MSRTRARSRKSTIIIVLIGLFTVAGLGTAFAYWTSSGTGNGAAATGTSVTFTVAGGTPTGVISPGGAGQTVPFTVTNPGPGTQYLTSVTVTIANTDGSTWVPTGGCDPTNYSATITPPAAGSMLVNGTKTGSVLVALADSGDNQDACKGQTVPLHFTAA